MTSASHVCRLANGKMEATTVVPAMAKKEVGVANTVEAGAAWSLSPKFRWVETEPDAALVAGALSETTKKLAHELAVRGIVLTAFDLQRECAGCQA